MEKRDTSPSRRFGSQQDEVAWSKIWSEHCRREAKTLKLQDKFAIGSLEHMQVLTAKPTATTPAQASVREGDVQRALAELQAVCTRKLSPKKEQGQERLPATANAAYGAAPLPLLARHQLFDFRKAASDATAFAAAYAAATGGSSPFARRQAQPMNGGPDKGRSQ